jgi:hypothetical protein
MGFEREVTRRQWFIKTYSIPSVEMSPQAHERNEQLEVYRRYAEHTFGDLKSRFGVLFVPFRYDRVFLNQVIRVCCALHNLILKYFHDPQNFKQQWTGPLSMLQEPQTRKVHCQFFVTAVFLHKSFFHIKQGKETLVRGTITKR